MAEVTVTIRPAAGVAVPKDLAGFPVEATYSRNRGAPPEDAAGAPTIAQAVASTTLDEGLKATLILVDPEPGTPVAVRVLSGTGAAKVQLNDVAPPAGRNLVLDLTADDVKAIATSDLTATPLRPTIVRNAQLVPVSGTPVDFGAATLRVVAVDPKQWTALSLDKVLNKGGIGTVSVELAASSLPTIVNLDWFKVHVGIDGRFQATFEEQPAHAWLWWLAGPGQAALGAVEDDLGKPRRDVLALPLPPFAAPATTTQPGSTRTPVNINEIELADNPDVFTEDPGAYCQPFSNPERILGERAFHVILRAEQPVISSEPTRKTPSFPLLDFDPPEIALPAEPERGRARRTVDSVRDRLAGAEATRRVSLSGWVNKGIDLARPRLPDGYLDLLDRNDRGRTDTDPEHPLDWEGDSSRYQAATVARGHILEYRLRWRSNGYSLGTVAKTLTLAPRQVKRIQKVEWERIETTRRTERTQLVDQEVDAVVRDRTYEDSVEASLSEWSRGESTSKTSAAAGGFGFAAPGFIAGGGGGHSRASSTSSQSGGRQTSASEEQRLRDSIRRFADSLRRLESVVVTEVSQEETVTGTTEIVRNANYAHSLTVIYYQILRHLKLETALGGVRECLFMPFAIKPFTLARAYRWRESIRAALRDPRYTFGLTHLRDVLTNFAGSNIPDIRRADQQVRYIRGSMSVSIGIERPKDGPDGAFDPVAWSVLRAHLGSPAVGIFSRLKELVEAYRDRVFQQEEAPRIAASWVNTLQLKGSGRLLPADFTLATRYRFNGTARVDFTAVIPPGIVMTRQLLTNLAVVAADPLPPGSVANLTGISYTYDTDTFRRSVSTVTGVADMIDPTTGAVDPGGATAFQGPDEWEIRNERDEVRRAVQDLLGHLNEHVEYYHKAIWWAMDRDRIFMIADGTYVPGTNGISVASLVERDPIAIIGNSLVFRVAAGAFLGIDGIKTPDELFGWYADRKPAGQPMHVALPTDGLYAQTIMDACEALEEHFGNTDWVLSDQEPELGTLDAALLMSRRAEPAGTAPTPFPQTIINLQNAPDAPAPSGLAGALNAVTNPNAFRDMAGLAGTQANAAAGLEVAANLATSFGNQAAALKLAQMAKSSQSTASADQRLATVQRAVSKGLATPESGMRHGDQILEELHAPTPAPPHEFPAINDAIERLTDGGTVEAVTSDGAVKVEFASSAQVAEPEVEEIELLSDSGAGLEVATAAADEKWVILVAGYNYLAHARGTTTYGTYARNRAAFILASNPAWKADTKVRFLLINVGEGKAYVDDRAKGPLTSQANWKPVSELRFTGTSEDVPLRFRPISSSDYSTGRFVYPMEMSSGLITPPGWEDRPVFSMIHWYNLLRTFGRAAPGTVIEASILSHGNPFGPILVNSFRGQSFVSATDPLNLAETSRERDPADVDGRADADFEDPNMSAADALEAQKAFASSGFVWLWGCAALGPFKRLVLGLYGQSGFKADGSTPNSKKFQFRFDTSAAGMQILQTALGNHAFLPTSGLTVQRSLGEFKSFLDVFLGTMYADRLADTFKVKCFATALGTGSEPDSGATFVVHHVTSTYEPVVEFYENYMTFKRDQEGRRYVDYKR